MRRSKQP